MKILRSSRRETLVGGFAAILTAPQIIAGTHGRDTATTIRGFQDEDTEAEAEDAARHAPFRAEFITWLQGSLERFSLPVSAHLETSSETSLHVPGLHPALQISLHGNGDINVYVTWNDVFWDILKSMDVSARPVPNGTGWHNDLFIPEAQRVYATREACWREDGFEWLLEWFNDELVSATHLALYGGDKCYEGLGWTSAHLARDGVLTRSGRSITSDGPLQELLPLYTARA